MKSSINPLLIEKEACGNGHPKECCCMLELLNEAGNTNLESKGGRHKLDMIRQRVCSVIRSCHQATDKRNGELPCHVLRNSIALRLKNNYGKRR